MVFLVFRLLRVGGRGFTGGTTGLIAASGGEVTDRGTVSFTGGVEVINGGTVSFTVGLEVSVGGTVSFTVGVDVITGGAVIFTGGADIFTGGADICTGGADIFTGGADVFTGGATLVDGPGLSTLSMRVVSCGVCLGGANLITERGFSLSIDDVGVLDKTGSHIVQLESQEEQDEQDEEDEPLSVLLRLAGGSITGLDVTGGDSSASQMRQISNRHWQECDR